MRERDHARENRCACGIDIGVSEECDEHIAKSRHNKFIKPFKSDKFITILASNADLPHICLTWYSIFTFRIG